MSGYPSEEFDESSTLLDTGETGEMSVPGDQVALGSIKLTTYGGVHEQSLIQFAQKVIFGNAANDSDSYVTTLDISDLSGGSGIYKMNPRSDLNRYWISSMLTRSPNMMTKPLRPLQMDTTSSAVGERRFVGEVWNGSGWKGVFIAGLNVYFVDNPATSLGTLAGYTGGKCINYKGLSATDKLLIPTGVGYATLTAAGTFAAVPSSATQPAAHDFEFWDGRINALDVNGKIWYTQDVASWLEYTGAGVPTYEPLGHLVNYYNRQGDPCLFVVTGKSVYQFVGAGPVLQEIRNCRMPLTPYSGLAATVWNDDLYMCTGMTVFLYNSGSRRNIGLDRNYGLPPGYVGHIVSMESSQNSLFALVQWDDEAGLEGTNYLSIHEWNSQGWQMIWSAEAGVATFASLKMSQHDGLHRLYWGFDNQLWYIDIPYGFYNPQSFCNAPIWAPGEYFLETGWFNADLAGYLKLGNAIEVSLENMTIESSFKVYYKIDYDSEEWHFAGSTNRNGISGFQLGKEVGDIGRGEIFQQIKFKFVMTDNSTYTPIMSYALFSCIKVSYEATNYQLSVDLRKGHDGRDPFAIYNELKSMRNSQRFFPFVHKGNIVRVMISQFSGDSSPADDQRGVYSISLTEIPEWLAKYWFRERQR